MSEQTDPGPAGPRPVRPGPAGAAVATRPAAAEDLSSEVARAVPRRAGDEVRCTRVGGDTYRCNWWAPQLPANPGGGRVEMAALVVASHRVRKSQFLRATRADGRLVITRCPPAPVVDDGG